MLTPVCSASHLTVNTVFLESINQIYITILRLNSQRLSYFNTLIIALQIFNILCSGESKFRLCALQFLYANKKRSQIIRLCNAVHKNVTPVLLPQSVQIVKVNTFCSISDVGILALPTISINLHQMSVLSVQMDVQAVFLKISVLSAKKGIKKMECTR